MSAAYASTLDISFDVRGGLVIRQMHHWAALLFMAAIVVHMLRIFFTGAFRKPRELNWIIGSLLFWIGFLAGFTGYSLPDDALSGTGLRIASGIILSVPVIGTWAIDVAVQRRVPRRLHHRPVLHPARAADTGLPGGVDPGPRRSGLPAEAHPVAGPGRTNTNVVGERMFPRYVIKQAGFFMAVFGVIALLGGLLQINPIWLFGPYEAAVVSAATQPDWYVMFLDGADPPHAGVGDHDPDRRRVRHPADVLAGRRAARPPDDAADVLSVHRGPPAPRQQGTTCSSARATSRPAPRSVRWRSPSTWC